MLLTDKKLNEEKKKKNDRKCIYIAPMELKILTEMNIAFRSIVASLNEISSRFSPFMH